MEKSPLASILKSEENPSDTAIKSWNSQENKFKLGVNLGSYCSILKRPRGLPEGKIMLMVLRQLGTKSVKFEQQEYPAF